MDHFCLSVSGVSEQELCAYLASRSIQHSEVATRYGAQGFGRSLYLSTLKAILSRKPAACHVLKTLTAPGSRWLAGTIGN